MPTVVQISCKSCLDPLSVYVSEFWDIIICTFIVCIVT